MSWYRKSGNRRRSSVSYSVASMRRASWSTGSTRNRSGSKGHVTPGEDDIELYLPPLEELPQIVGYETVTFESSLVPPPLLPVITEVEGIEEEADLKPFTEPARLSEIEARRALVRHAESRCIYDIGAAHEADIVSIESEPAYKYTLESFTETRHVAWTFEPYTGGALDEAAGARPPLLPWAVAVPAPTPFQSHHTTVAVPRTDLLAACRACSGTGSRRCTACAAAGWERCSICLGVGHKISLQNQRERCFRCLGTGRKKCWKCGGDTIAVCLGCGGTGQIRCFIGLTVTWTNHADSAILEPEEAADISGKLEYAEGKAIYQDEKPVILSVIFPVKKLQTTAFTLLEKHVSISSTEKLILQRHGVWAIPIHRVIYVWRHKRRILFVYGAVARLHGPDFPESLCCCCAIS